MESPFQPAADLAVTWRRGSFFLRACPRLVEETFALSDVTLLLVADLAVVWRSGSNAQTSFSLALPDVVAVGWLG